MFLAVPRADKPATPPPMTSNLAGGTRPAAVICPVKKRGKCWAASITALQTVAGTLVGKVPVLQAGGHGFDSGSVQWLRAGSSYVSLSPTGRAENVIMLPKETS
jgi:hypothetical protein